MRPVIKTYSTVSKWHYYLAYDAIHATTSFLQHAMMRHFGGRYPVEDVIFASPWAEDIVWC